MVNDLKSYQENEIEKEGKFKNTMERTNSIIQWCAIGQAVIFCIIGIYQIFALRKFFAKRGLGS